MMQLQSALALWMPRYYGQNPDFRQKLRGLTENDCCYYGLSLLRNYRHFRGTNRILLSCPPIMQTREILIQHNYVKLQQTVFFTGIFKKAPFCDHSSWGGVGGSQFFWTPIWGGSFGEGPQILPSLFVVDCI